VVIPISPEQAVHGYKWRRPRGPYDPRAITPATEHIPTIALAHVEGAKARPEPVRSPSTESSSSKLEIAMDHSSDFVEALAKIEQQISTSQTFTVVSMK
jgi:hypothetical protein